MRKVDGISIKHRIFLPESYFKQYNPDLSQIHLVKICLQIIRAVKELHEQDIILGDFNPNNFLLDHSTNIHLIDTDNFQLHGYPCDALYQIHAAPELYSTPVFTKQSDLFALASLLFSILMIGLNPYQQLGSGAYKEHLLQGSFQYHLKKVAHDKIPLGHALYSWISMPQKVRNAFYQTFHFKGHFFQEANRIKLETWEKILHDYYLQLKKGTACANLFNVN